MLSLTVHFANKDSFVTGFNGSVSDALNYYLGKTFTTSEEKQTYCHALECDGIEYNTQTHRYGVDKDSHIKNLDNIAAIEAMRATKNRIMVGDVVKVEGGFKRVAHIWDDSIQLTDYTSANALGGSFSVGRSGSASYSGGLNPGIAKDKFTFSGDHMPARFWCFHLHDAKAHNGIHFNLNTPIYTLTN